MARPVERFILTVWETSVKSLSTTDVLTAMADTLFPVESFTFTAGWSHVKIYKIR